MRHIAIETGEKKLAERWWISGDFSAEVFRNVRFGRIYSYGVREGGCAISLFPSFFQCHWQGNAIQEAREIRRWIFLSLPYVSYFSFLFPFLLIRERRTLEPAKWDKRLIRKLSLPFYFFLEKNTFFLKSLRQVFHVWKM